MECTRCGAELSHTGRSYHHGLRLTQAYEHYKCPSCKTVTKTLKVIPKEKKRDVRV